MRICSVAKDRVKYFSYRLHWLDIAYRYLSTRTKDILIQIWHARSIKGVSFKFDSNS